MKKDIMSLLKKPLPGRPFKKLGGKAQERFKAEAYFRIREGLNVLQQRSRRGIFNGLMRRPFIPVVNQVFLLMWSWRQAQENLVLVRNPGLV